MTTAVILFTRCALRRGVAAGKRLVHQHLPRPRPLPLPPSPLPLPVPRPRLPLPESPLRIATLRQLRRLRRRPRRARPLQLLQPRHRQLRRAPTALGPLRPGVAPRNFDQTYTKFSFRQLHPLVQHRPPRLAGQPPLQGHHPLPQQPLHLPRARFGHPGFVLPL